MKKDSYPLPRIQEALESLVGAGIFFLFGPQVGVLADTDGGGIEAVHCLLIR